MPKKIINISEEALGDLINQAFALRDKKKSEVIEFDQKGKVEERSYFPAPYEPCELNGLYRCDCCGFYFDLDEGEFKDEMFLCKQDFNELNLLEEEERKGKSGVGEPS